MIVLTVITCLQCGAWWNTNPRTQFSVGFETMEGCLVIQRKWESDMDVKVLKHCHSYDEGA
tara:strand:+ start:638 stop:820 length:183 start_codon:yes stop_codon:yes gene_type:complete